MILGGFTDNFDKGMLSLLMMLSAIAIMLILMRRHQFRSATRRDVSREQIARLRDQRNLQQSMDELLLQIEEMSRQVSAQLDTKYAKLELVIRDADERIARLENLLGRRETAAAPVAAAPSGTMDSTRAANVSRAREKTRSVIAATDRQTFAEASPASGTSGGKPPISRENDDPRFKQIYDLADAGHTPIQTAEALALPLGEVELILNLRKFR